MIQPLSDASQKRRALSSFCALLCFLCLSLFSFSLHADERPSADVLLIIGAPGTDQFGETFQSWAERWTQAAQRGNAAVTIIGPEIAEQSSPREQLQSTLEIAKAESQRPFWLVLIGHGTFDRRTARFNLAGPDVSAEDLAEWLAPIKRPVAVVDCSACSSPFITALSAPDRVVITATKTGGEENFTRFGEFMAKSLDDVAADLDKDDQTSLWEAYLAASRRTAEFYQSDGRLQTEHALLDDNGDKQGTRADIFQGLALKTDFETAGDADGALAHQWHLVPSDRDAKLPPEVRRQRDELELRILKLRERKAKFEEDEYYLQLEELLVELARLNSFEREASAP